METLEVEVKISGNGIRNSIQKEFFSLRNYDSIPALDEAIASPSVGPFDTVDEMFEYIYSTWGDDNQMKHKVEFKNNFKKGLGRYLSSGKDDTKIRYVINKLASGQKLEPKYNDHKLKGKYKEYRECHIEYDWLLMYKIENDKLILTLMDMGSHSDLFGK